MPLSKKKKRQLVNCKMLFLRLPGLLNVSCYRLTVCHHLTVPPASDHFQTVAIDMSPNSSKNRKEVRK